MFLSLKVIDTNKKTNLNEHYVSVLLISLIVNLPNYMSLLQIEGTHTYHFR